MSGNRVCWNRAATAFATQIDVGGFEVDDERGDAVFAAIHQPLPLKKIRDVRGERESSATEDDLRREFTKPSESNEPLLLFITGHKGTGKSHLVRWLKSKIGPQPSWHVVYIEKRNTNLRRVIERILDGIDTPKATQLREALAKAGSEISSDEEAMSALLSRLDHLVTFDKTVELKVLPNLSPAEINNLRELTHRLLGDFTFRKELTRPDGPIHRIVHLALSSAGTAETDEADLYLTEGDLVVDPTRFEDLGPQLQQLVRQVNGSKLLREDIAALCDSYLEQAKAQVFTGPSTDLLEVFEDVRKEIKTRGRELCLFVEDLVLLHGIDKQLAQALTIPASGQLCKLRAAIAVTDGYLKSVDTFADRGIHFQIDVDLSTIGASGLRDFVGRYLNVGRLTDDDLLTSVYAGGPNDITPNACMKCPDRVPCHETFGRTGRQHGLYPFNAAALDRLVGLASPGEFKPREILRQVIRASLETAEEELPTRGTFPSEEFAHTLDETRRMVPVEVRTAVRRQNLATPQAELTLRAFYSEQPPAIDQGVRKIADYLGVTLSTVDADADAASEVRELEKVPSQDDKHAQADAALERLVDEFERWTAGDRLLSGTAHKIRTWICETTVSYLRDGCYGLAVSRVGRFGWRIGSYEMRTTDVVIDRSAGGGGPEPKNPFRIKVTDENALMLRGIYKASEGEPLDAVDGGVWFFPLQARIARYADSIARIARDRAEAEVSEAARVLTILRNAASEPGTTVREALPAMLGPTPPAPLNPTVQSFLSDARSVRENGLIALRNHATAAKGAGKPSIIDVGLVHADVQAHLKVRSFDSLVANDGHGALQNLQVKLERAARKAWAEVAEVIRELERFLDPQEDLVRTMSIVGQLIERCHADGKLPNPQSKNEYDAAAKKIEPAVMGLYRKLAKRVADSPGPGGLWEVREDPTPRLRDLSDYAQVTDRLLTGLEKSLGGRNADAVAVDTDDLVEQFRGLAHVLDDVVKQGERS